MASRALAAIVLLLPAAGRPSGIGQFIDGPLPSEVRAARDIAPSPPSPGYREGDPVRVLGMRGEMIEAEAPGGGRALVPWEATDLVARVGLRLPEPGRVRLREPWPGLGLAGAEIPLVSAGPGPGMLRLSAGGPGVEVPAEATDYGDRRAALVARRDSLAAVAVRMGGGPGGPPSDRLEFGGVRIGMRRDLVAAIAGAGWAADPGPGPAVLRPDPSGGDAAALLGGAAPWARATLDYSRDRVARLLVIGPCCGPAGLRDWCAAVRAALAGIHGEPGQEAELPAELPAGASGIALAEWVLGDQRIRLCARAEGRSFAPALEYARSSEAR